MNDETYPKWSIVHWEFPARGELPPAKLTWYDGWAHGGKRPPDGRLEWEVLGKRDRAALNENFARELPLEYRAILKDYYERLAR